MIKFDDYQTKIIEFMNPEVMASETDILLNSVLGMTGEAGEVADVIKKWLFHKQDLDLSKLDKEAGDVLFYIALYCNARNIKLSDLAQLNVDKLTARYEGKTWTPEASKAKKDEADTSTAQ